nr:MAG TPA: hypothetical protein [Caudoviricetes sp.]
MDNRLQRYEEKSEKPVKIPEKQRITYKKSEKIKKLSVNFRLIPKKYPYFS